MSRQALSLVETIAANVNNSQITDTDFREFVRNSLTVIPEAVEVLKRFAPKENENDSKN